MSKKRSKKSNKGVSRKTDEGILIIRGKYLRLPYSILQSSDFKLLNPIAVKIYFVILSHWYTHKPDEHVSISIRELRKHLPTTCKKGKYVGYHKIEAAINQLCSFGFIEKEYRDKQCNIYHIEQRRFTGEWE
jgi:hypothetical protein